MRDTAIVSLVLHALVFLAAITVVKKTSHVPLPSPYMVRLVTPVKTTPKKARPAAGKVKTRKKTTLKTVSDAKAAKKKERAAKKKAVTVKKAPPPSEAVSVEDRIAAIRAKKRIEKVVALRRRVLSVRKEKGAAPSKGTGTEKALPAEGAGGGESLIAGYYALVQERVWSEWVFPDFGSGKGLETVVDIRIYRDGRVKVQGVRKSSGNPLFDRSVLRAISKASPLPPPPYELEVSIRFTP